MLRMGSREDTSPPDGRPPRSPHPRHRDFSRRTPCNTPFKPQPNSLAPNNNRPPGQPAPGPPPGSPHSKKRTPGLRACQCNPTFAQHPGTVPSRNGLPGPRRARTKYHPGGHAWLDEKDLPAGDNRMTTPRRSAAYHRCPAGQSRFCTRSIERWFQPASAPDFPKEKSICRFTSRQPPLALPWLFS